MSDSSAQIAMLIEGMNLSDEQIALLTQNLANLKTQALIDLDDSVARAKEGTKITRRGFDLLGKAIAGKELHFTRVRIGDAVVNGEMVLPSDEEAYEMNALINPRMDITMTDCQFTGGGTCAVKCQVRNAEVKEGFRIAEVGLFATDPDTGEEILYCYRNTGIASDWMPSGDGAVLWDITLSIITVVDKATNVTAVIDANLAYVSQNEFAAHVNANNPHPNIPNVQSDIDYAPRVWAENNDLQLHPIAIENLARQILGGDANSIPKISSRLTQAEINLANLYMQLNMEKELGLQPNLMLVEDFEDKKNCDLYSCAVVTAAAGVNTIQLESDQGILPGSWYTISDGTRSEYVQIHSVIKNGDKVMVVLEQLLTNTYDLTRTRLLRSSTLINNGEATGAGDILGQQLTIDEVWKGTGGNVENELILDTTQKNSSSFTITGDGGFNTNGFFTLTA